MSAILARAPGARADDPGPLAGLVDTAAQRLQTADPVAASKGLTNGSIEDATRAEQVIAAVTALAATAGVEPGYVRQVFADQIAATEAVEYSRFAQWKLDPVAAPTAAPDLTVSRSAIDALNRQMVDEIAAQWTVLRSPGCTRARDEAVTYVADARQLDAVYRQALGFATRSYCTGS
ncbi:MAG: chorismate mutase [Candidatus Sericytochromatia bacterium]